MKRITSLDGLRFVFCVTIIFSHFEFLLDSVYFKDLFIIFKNPTIGVDYFFMLSGFGIYLSNRLGDTKPTLRNSIGYAVGKIKKIYPAYIISLCLGFIYVFLSFDHGFLIKRFLGYVALFGIDSMLIQSLFGISDVSLSINGVAWFLSSLFISYILCPVFFCRVKMLKNRKELAINIILTIAIILGLSLVAIKLQNISNGILDNIWYSHPFIRCWYLALGMLAAYIYKEEHIRFGSLVEVLSVVIATIYFFGRQFVNINYTFIRLLDIIVCFSFLLVIASGNGVISRILKNDRLVGLGNDAMYFYLFHYPIRIIIDYLLKDSSLNVESLCVIKIVVIILGTALITCLYKKNSKQINHLFEPLFDRIE